MSQPPWGVMSVAPVRARGSQRKLLTHDPSMSSALPMTSGAGTAAVKRPKASGVRAKVSTAMGAPVSEGEETRARPGLGGVVLASA